MKNFIKSFFAFGLATSLQKLISFIILPIYVKEFTPSEYGILEMINTLVSVSVVFGILQLETSLQRYFYENNGIRRKLLISNIYGLITIASIFVGLILVCLSNFISNLLFKTDAYAILITIIAFQIPFINIKTLGLILLRYQKLNIKFLIVVIFYVLTLLSCSYLFVVFYKLGLPGVFYAQLLASIIASIAVSYFVKDLLIFKYSKIVTKKVINYAYPQFPARVGSMLLQQSNRFFMLAFLSLTAIGIYSVSMKLASLIQLVNTAFIMAWAPFMHAQFKKDNNKIVFANVFPLVVGLACLCISIITLSSNEIVSIIATEGYYESYKYIGGISLFFALYIIKEVIDIGPKIKEKTKYLSFTFFISVIVNIVSLYFLIQNLELKGVVIAMIITNLTLVIVSWIVSNKLYYINFSIIKFCCLFIPALVITLVTLFFELETFYRYLILFFLIMYYSLGLLISFKNFKKLI